MKSHIKWLLLLSVIIVIVIRNECCSPILLAVSVIIVIVRGNKFCLPDTSCYISHYPHYRHRYRKQLLPSIYFLLYQSLSSLSLSLHETSAVLLHTSCCVSHYRHRHMKQVLSSHILLAVSVIIVIVTWNKCYLQILLAVSVIIHKIYVALAVSSTVINSTSRYSLLYMRK
jgi:hypothetical protein